MYAPLCIFLLFLNYEGHYLISHTPTVLQVNAKPITALPTPTQQPAQRYTSQDPCTFPQKCITESAQPLLEIHIKSHFTIHLSLRSSFTTHGGLRLLKYYPGISLDSQLQIHNTHSLPVQKLDASLANQAITPRNSSGRPIRPIGFNLDHFSSRCGCLSRYAAVILVNAKFSMIS